MPRTTKDPLMQALYEAAKGPGSMDIHTILDAADRLSEQQQVIDELVRAVSLAIDLVDKDVIRVRPSDRDELLRALSEWNETLYRAKESVE